MFVKHGLHVCPRLDAVASRPTLLPALLMFPSPLFLLSLLLAGLFLGLHTCCGDRGCCARACCNVRLSVHLYDAEADTSTSTDTEVQQVRGEEDGDQEEDWRVCIVQCLTSLANCLSNV